MARLNIQKTSFTAGEISPRLLGRGDLRAYQNGAARLRNVFVHPTGGLSRRPGLRHIDTARGAGRLVPFEFNTEQVYLLVFTDSWIDVYRDGVKVTDFAAPWSETQIPLISWVKSADTLLVTHIEVPPKKSFARERPIGRLRIGPSSTNRSPPKVAPRPGTASNNPITNSPMTQ